MSVASAAPLQIICCLHLAITSSLNFWVTVTSNGSPYDTGPLSCLSVCL